MATTVYFKLYQSNGSSLAYTFPVVFQANYPYSDKNTIIHENPRGKGAIVISGGDKAWTLTLKGCLQAADYDALVVLMDGMESSIVNNTSYVLKINKTSSTYYSYNVKRCSPIIFDETNLKTDYIEYTIDFLVNSW
jgi:hypothetical protein